MVRSKSGKKKIIRRGKSRFVPTAGYVLIEPREVESKTAGGIYLPETGNTEKPQIGKILAVGDEEILDSGMKRKSPAKVGEDVVYKKWGGNEIKEGGKEYLFVKFEDIIAVIK